MENPETSVLDFIAFLPRECRESLDRVLYYPGQPCVILFNIQTSKWGEVHCTETTISLRFLTE